MKKILLTLTISILSFSLFAQDNDDGGDFDYGICGIYEAGDVTISGDIECLDVKNGTMAAFKITLMYNGGTSVKQFEMHGKCLSEKAIEALKTAPSGTQIMFGSVKQVALAGDRVDIAGKNFTIVD